MMFCRSRVSTAELVPIPGSRNENELHILDTCVNGKGSQNLHLSILELRLVQDCDGLLRHRAAVDMA